MLVNLLMFLYRPYRSREGNKQSIIRMLIFDQWYQLTTALNDKKIAHLVAYDLYTCPLRYQGLKLYILW